MATSIRDLLDSANTALATQPINAQTADAIMAATRHAARALANLSSKDSDPLLGGRRRQATVARLVSACDHAATSWPTATGTIADLLGAAADIAGRRRNELTPDQRWAVSIAIADTARRCCDAARRFPPYEHIPHLLRVREAAAAVAQHAAADPPRAAARVVLDRYIPRTSVEAAVAGPGAALEAIAALVEAVHAANTAWRLTLAEALAVSAVAQTVATHACASAVALAGEAGPTAEAWRSAPHAWQAVPNFCAPFDDGTKRQPTDASRVIVWAVTLDRALRSGLAAAPSLNSTSDAVDPAHVTQMRQLANTLPKLAAQLNQATHHWEAQETLLGPERRLPSYESRNQAVTTTDRVVPVNADDLAELRQHLIITEHLSIDLSAQLNQSASAIGAQPQPFVATALAARRRELGLAHALTPAADEATRRAAAAPPAEWVITRRPTRAPRR